MLQKAPVNEAGYTYVDALIGVSLLALILASIVPFFRSTAQILPDVLKLRNENLSLVLFFRDLYQTSQTVELDYWSSGEAIIQEGELFILPTESGEIRIYPDSLYWVIKSEEGLRRYKVKRQVKLSIDRNKQNFPTGLICEINENEYKIYFSKKVLEKWEI